jgi:hypothetical protein
MLTYCRKVLLFGRDWAGLGVSVLAQYGISVSLRERKVTVVNAVFLRNICEAMAAILGDWRWG